MSTETISQTVPRIPRINEPAPDFQAKSTHGMIKLSDYTSKGKWVLLFSHPADFTPVCTTEFVEFARHAPEFDKRNVQLIGNSIDSVYSHIAWIRNIEQNFNVKVPFLVIADLDQKVAKSFDTFHPSSCFASHLHPTPNPRFLPPLPSRSAKPRFLPVCLVPTAQAFRLFFPQFDL